MCALQDVIQFQLVSFQAFIWTPPTFLIPNFHPSTHFSHHIHDSLWFLHTPLYAFYYALCVLKSSMHLCSLFKNVHWNKKRAPKNKTFAQASSMGRLTQHETTFMPSSWQKTNFDPLFKPFVLFLVLGLKLWPLNQTNMSFQCHVCSTLWISLICDNQILWTMLRNWM
jgi:hypothetical protein